MPGWRNVLCLRPASHLPCKLFAASNRTICCMQRPFFDAYLNTFFFFFVRSSGHHAAFPSQHLLMPVAWQSIPSSDFKFDIREGVGLDGELQSFQLIYATCPPFYVTFLSFQFRCQHFFLWFFSSRNFVFLCAFFNTFFSFAAYCLPDASLGSLGLNPHEAPNCVWFRRCFVAFIFLYLFGLIFFLCLCFSDGRRQFLQRSCRAHRMCSQPPMNIMFFSSTLFNRICLIRWIHLIAVVAVP